MTPKYRSGLVAYHYLPSLLSDPSRECPIWGTHRRHERLLRVKVRYETLNPQFSKFSLHNPEILKKHTVIIYLFAGKNVAPAVQTSVRIIIIPDWILIYFGLHTCDLFTVDYEKAIARHFYQWLRIFSVYRFSSKIMLLDTASGFHKSLSGNCVIKIKEFWTDNVPLIVQLFQIRITIDELCNNTLIE